LTALVLIAVAVASNTAVFAFVRGTLLDTPPYRSPEQLVLAWGSEPVNGQLRDVISGSNFIDLRRRTTSLASLAAFHGDDVVMMRDGRPEVLAALEVTVDFLRVLGVDPIVGSDFRPEDRFGGAQPTALISYGTWQSLFGGRADAIGSIAEIDDVHTTILGVLPRDFRFAGEWSVLIPLRDDDLAAEDRTHHHYFMVGRERPGVGAAAATQEMTAILADIAAGDPRLTRWRVLVEPMLQATVEAVRPALWLIAAAALMAAGITVVNLGMLLRIRTLERLGELSVRIAVGGARSRVLAAIVVEALVLSGVGSALGLLAAPAARDLLSIVAPPVVLIPHSAAAVPVLRATLDPSVLVSAAAAALVAGLLLAVPAVVAARRAMPGLLTSRSGARVASAPAFGWMVSAELTIASMLALGAGLTIRSAQSLESRDPGLNPVAVLTTYFGNVDALPVAERAEYFRRVIDAVSGLPGVVRAGTNDYRPFEGEDDFKGFRVADRPAPPRGQSPREEWRRVSEGYFDTVGMRLVRGRGFTPEDFVGAPRSVVINQAFASKHFRDEDPLGRRLVVAEPGYTDVRIVGVLADVLVRGVTEPAPPVLYAPFQAAPRGHVALFVKVAGDPMSYASSVRSAIWSVDSRQPVLSMLPLEEVVLQSMAIPTMVSRIVSTLAAVSLMLAGVGVLGVVGFAVRARTRELGVRMALGATAARLQYEILAGFAPTVALSILAGLAAAALSFDGLRAFLYGVPPTDPLAFAMALAPVTLIAFLAMYLPLRRLTRLDPARVLLESSP
jgi:putative ABC transport system permease protein